MTELEKNYFNYNVLTLKSVHKLALTSTYYMLNVTLGFNPQIVHKPNFDILTDAYDSHSRDVVEVYISVMFFCLISKPWLGPI